MEMLTMQVSSGCHAWWQGSRWPGSTCGLFLHPLEQIRHGNLQALHAIARGLAEGDAAGILLVAGGAGDFTGGEAGAQGADEHLVVEDEVVAEAVEGHGLQELARVGAIA